MVFFATCRRAHAHHKHTYTHTHHTPPHLTPHAPAEVEEIALHGTAALGALVAAPDSILLESRVK